MDRAIEDSGRNCLVTKAGVFNSFLVTPEGGLEAREAEDTEELVHSDSEREDIFTEHQDNAEFALAMCPTEPYLSDGREIKVGTKQFQAAEALFTYVIATNPIDAQVKSMKKCHVNQLGLNHLSGYLSFTGDELCSNVRQDDQEIHAN
ncbi:hypothetical protein Taro_037322 [Colocasia esculenta]|uniref:Uncharacterized protein n=1 Tax=Colocasia esculenta TaxID=4460 RepID=A0A843W3V4_COLES|nr:hypothetical protein [Colocasia esculenta]